MSEPVDSTTEVSSAVRRVRLVKLGGLALVLLAGAVLIMQGYDVKGAIQQGLELVRGAGPAVFFLAMAILPALGVPQMAFILSAGPLFGPQLGIAVVVLLALSAMTCWMRRPVWTGTVLFSMMSL